MNRTRTILLAVVLLVALPSAASAASAAAQAPGTVTPVPKVFLPLILRPLGAPLAAADVAAVLDAIETRFNAMSNQNDMTGRAALANYIRALPHIADAGVEEEEGAVWAYFTDGRMVTILVTLPGAVITPTASPAPAALPASFSARPAQELPSGDTVYLLDAMGTCFSHVIPEISPWIATKNYVIAPAQPTVPQLKTIHDASVFYIDSHGGTVRGLNGFSYAMWTLTQWSLARDAEYLDDIMGGRLVYILTDHDVAPSGNGCLDEWHYGITAAFVTQYMTFAPHSFVFFNGCSSMSLASQPMRGAFALKGASRYAGWTRSVVDLEAVLAAKILFDQMLGASAVFTDTLPQRPFDLDTVFASMQHDGWNRLQIESFTTDPKLKFNLLAPTIARVFTRKGTYNTTQPPMALEMIGQFGSEPGKVTVGGQEVSVHTWTPTFIRAALSGNGPGSAGDVVVSVRNHASNPVPLSEWRGRFRWHVDYNTYVVPAEGLTADVDCQLQWRADYHAFRLNLIDPPQQLETAMVGGQDSRCVWTMQGDVTWTSLGSLYRGVLTGAGEIAWLDPRGLPVFSPFVNPGGVIDLAQHTMILGASVGGVFGELAVYRDGVLEQIDQVALLGAGPVPVTPGPTGSILAGTGTYDWPLGRSAASWGNIPVQHVPTDKTPG